MKWNLVNVVCLVVAPPLIAMVRNRMSVTSVQQIEKEETESGFNFVARTTPNRTSLK